MKKLMILMVASLMATAASAKVTPQQKRDFYRKAYDVVKTYARASQLNDNRDKAQFHDLFESPETPVTNDLMGLDYEPTLSAARYAELLGDADMVTVTLRDVKKEDEISEEDGKLVMPLSYLKRMSFLSPCNTVFDSYDFFGRDYHQQMLLVYDPQTEECRIREITSFGIRPEFPQNYRVLIRNGNDKRDNNLDINGKYVNFIMDQKILHPNDQVYYRGAKVKLQDSKDQCDHKVYAVFNDKKWRVRLNGSFAIGGFNKLGNDDNINVGTNNDMSFGLDFGYVFPTTSHFRVGVFAGIGVSMNNLDLSMAGKQFSTSDAEDVDGDKYTRYYTASNSTENLVLKQKMKTTNLSIPVYADLEYEFNSIFSVYADAGLKFSLPMSHKIEIENNAFETYGKYGGYGDLTINQYINNFGPEGYTKYNNGSKREGGSVNALKLYEDGLTAKTTINAILGLGVRFNVTKTIAIDAGVQYQLGFKENWEADTSKELFCYKLDSNNDYNNNTLNVGQDYVNIMNKVGTLKHSSLRANVSLIFKF